MTEADLAVEPVVVLQHRAYPEAVTGRFISLADFEATSRGRAGHEQVRHFRMTPATAGGELKYVVNVTRTGVGAMEAAVPPGASLVYTLDEVHNFSDYSLLSVAVYAREVRDDLKVLLVTDQAGWESLPVLLDTGWNHVQIDLERLKRLPNFDARGVRGIRFWFASSAASADAVSPPPVRVNLDDILLIDNRRSIEPIPAGLKLTKAGLDYTLSIAGRSEPVRIVQSDDGLWRLGRDQALMTLFPAAAAAGEGKEVVGEDLSAFGPRRIGEVKVLEHNALRLRLANTWYFPTSAGEWVSLSVRQIRWEYTFYADGRMVTDVVLNNAGGQDVSALRIAAPEAAAWSEGVRRAVLEVPRFLGPVGRWSFLRTLLKEDAGDFQANYVKPGQMAVRIGKRPACDGDVDGDGFDESQGCYHLQAEAGNCRFTIAPADGPLVSPVFRIRGAWTGAVSASADGLALRGLERLDGGETIFVLPGRLDGPRNVEVSGTVPLIPADGR